MADLLRRQLADRGAVVVEQVEPRPRVIAALVGTSCPVPADADIIVRLPQSGATLPTEVQVEVTTCGPGESRLRLVTITTIADLIDLLVGLAKG